MNYESFKHPLVFDGGMGAMLLSLGLSPGECPEYWNILKPEIVMQIHKAFIEAGAEVIQTNTFGANHIKLANFGLENEVFQINKAAVINARKAAGSKAQIALSVGPTGEILEPWGIFAFDDAIDIFAQQIKAALPEKPDFIIIETMTQLSEARAALLAAKSLTDIPVIVTMSFENNGRTTFGTSPEAAAVTLNAMGADVVGVNCVGDTSVISDIVMRMSKAIGKPIIAQPNAGIPVVMDQSTFYPLKPEDFAKACIELVRTGAGFIGGCCGTNPSHIRELAQMAKHISFPKIKLSIRNAVTNNFDAIYLDPKGPVVIIGEHANPSISKKIQTELISGDFSSVVEKAKQQVEKGALIVDVNVGVPGEAEAPLMRRAVQEIQKSVRACLCIDTSDNVAIEEGLKHFHGRAILNSVDGNPKKLEKLLPIAKKYGSMVIGLTLDEKGVNTTAKERLEIAKKIVEFAKKYGISAQDLIIDGLVLTLSAQQKYALEAINTVRLVKQNLNCLTTLGLSNISHGVPKRAVLNKTFLAMAIAAGLDLPMIDPYRNEIQDIIASSEFITGRDVGGKSYLNLFGKSVKHGKKTPQIASGKLSVLYDSILKGDEVLAEKSTEQLLAKKPSLDIINQAIIPSLTEVGDSFEKGELFLPQLLLSAQAAQTAFSAIKEAMGNELIQDRGSVVLATVEGDIHDIGKNIVKVLLENYGFSVVDLGKDVPAEKIVQTISPDIKLIGLSALMTTTIASMEKTIALLKDKGFCGSIMVGGAVLSESLAQKIDADFYAKDALTGVRIAEKIYS
ncbi:MAG: homocysteine S-methyltransferase family protein [Tepidanaerobacteraceae bacterium]|jgi:5-methyltetrahydrofolate--homocysteine methyltransferase